MSFGEAIRQGLWNGDGRKVPMGGGSRRGSAVPHTPKAERRGGSDGTWILPWLVGGVMLYLVALITPEEVWRKF